MAYKIDGKPVCGTHPNSTAEVLCKSHRRFLCTQCLIDREVCEGSCDLVQLRNIKSKQEIMAVDLILLEQYSSMKLEARKDVENFVEEQKKDVEESIDGAFDQLVEKLENMKEESKQQMRKSFDHQLDRTLREKTSLERAIHSIQGAINELITEKDAFRKEGRNYQYYDTKKKQAQRALINLSDGDHHGYGKFVLAAHLQDIVSERKKTFGKSTLMMRFVPKS